MALNIMYCVDVPLHVTSGLFMFTLPPKRGTTRKQKLIKKGQLLPSHQGGYVFISVSLFVGSITQQLLDPFSQNTE